MATLKLCIQDTAAVRCFHAMLSLLFSMGAMPTAGLPCDASTYSAML